MELTRENYFDYGSLDRPVFSASSLEHIYPHQGGSLKRLIAFLSGGAEKKEYRSLTTGKLMHSYFEDTENFKISPENAPSDAIQEVIQAVYDSVRVSGVDFGTITDWTDKILTEASRLKYGVGQKLKTDTIIKRITEQQAYYKHLVEASDAIIIDAKTKTTLTGIMSTFENDPDLRRFIDFSNEGNDDIIILRELPILHRIGRFDCKSLLDRLEIDTKNKRISYYDYKSTSYPISLFMGTIELVPDFTNNWFPKPLAVQGAFQKYHIYRQIAFYQNAIAQYMIDVMKADVKEYKISHNIIACETNSQFEAGIIPVTSEWLAAGIEEIQLCFKVIDSVYDQIVKPPSNEY